VQGYIGVRAQAQQTLIPAISNEFSFCGSPSVKAVNLLLMHSQKALFAPSTGSGPASIPCSPFTSLWLAGAAEGG